MTAWLTYCSTVRPASAAKEGRDKRRAVPDFLLDLPEDVHGIL